MYQTAKALITLGAIAAVSACGGSEALLDPVASALDYDPAYADTPDATVTTALNSGGATGVAIIYNLEDETMTFEGIEVERLSGGEPQVRLTSNGALTGGNDLLLTFEGDNSWTDGTTTILFSASKSGDSQRVTLSGTPRILSSGFIGPETRPENIFSGDLTYNGEYLLSLLGPDIRSNSGDIQLVVDFGDNTLSGELVSRDISFGVITGRTQDNGILGTVTLTPDSGFSGELDILGKAFGAQGTTIAGVMGSTDLTRVETDDTYAGVGYFEAFLD